MTASYPLPPPLYAACACGRVLRLAGEGHWTLCDCGRAVRLLGRIEIAESAADWARREA